MVKYKFNDEVAKFLDDLKALGGLQIETLTPIEARKMNLMEMPSPEAVSYTHLTLPTTVIV